MKAETRIENIRNILDQIMANEEIGNVFDVMLKHNPNKNIFEISRESVEQYSKDFKNLESQLKAERDKNKILTEKTTSMDEYTKKCIDNL